MSTNNFNIDQWLEDLLTRLRAEFGRRLVFMGLEGSYSRGEAKPDSDIDVVVVLDKIDTQDLRAYKAIIDSMPNSEKACGYISSVAERRNHEPRSESVHLYYNCQPIYGSLDGIIPDMMRSDLIAEIRMRMANTLHCARHYLIFPHDLSSKVHNLRMEFKYAPVHLRWWMLLTTGSYIKSTDELLKRLADPDDIEIVRITLNWKSLADDRTQRPLYYIELLERWARGMLDRVLFIPPV